MKKDSLIIFNLIILFVIFITVGCKKVEIYDINGTWQTTIVESDGNFAQIFVFTGDNKSGIISGGYSQTGMGTYNIVEKKVTFTYWSNMENGLSFSFSGNFSEKNKMAGAVIILNSELNETTTHNWYAIRI